MATHCDLITTLPVELSSVILQEWLDLSIHIVARLDSSYCNHHRRVILSKLLKTRIAVKCNVCEDGDEYKLSWLLRKGIHVSDMEIGMEPTNSVVVDYLAKFGVSLRKLCFSNEGMSDCLQLWKLRYAALRTMVEFSVHLEELEFNCGIYLTEKDANDRIHLPQLKRLKFGNGEVPNLFTEMLIHSGHQLQELRLGSAIKRAHVLSLLRSSPQLRAVSFANDTIDLTIMHQLHVLCPNIISLELSPSFDLNDDHVALLVRHLRLKWLNISGCEKLTDQALTHIAEHCSDTLESFHFNFGRQFSSIGVGLPAFFAKCRNIHTILSYDSWFYCEPLLSPDFYHSLFAQWSNITYLRVEGRVLQNGLSVLAMHCKQVTCLDVCNLFDYFCKIQVIAEELRPVLQGLPKLRTLIVHEGVGAALAVMPERLALTQLDVISIRSGTFYYNKSVRDMML